MEAFMGTITICGFDYAPRGYARCDGGLLPVSQNTALFSILSNNYGGNGSVSFGLPDLKGSAAIHADRYMYPVGMTGGSDTVTLDRLNLPPHGHAMAAGTGADATAPAGKYPGASGNYDAGPANAVMSPLMLAEAGNSQPINIVKPHVTMNFVIALWGIYPMRG